MNRKMVREHFDNYHINKGLRKNMKYVIISCQPQIKTRGGE